MAEEAKSAGAKSNNPKPIPKPGSLKTPTAAGGKKGIKGNKKRAFKKRRNFTRRHAVVLCVPVF